MKRRWNKLLLVVVVAASASIAALPTIAARYCRYRGEADLKRFQNQAALEWMTAAARYAPGDAETHFLLARCHRRPGRFDDMERFLDRAARLGCPAQRIERERRLSIAQTGRVQTVAQYLSGMLMAPGDDGAEICASYVSGYCLSFDFQAAGSLLEAWSKDFENDPEPHFRTGDLWYAQNEWAKAVDCYRRCLALDAAHRKARLSLAQCLMRRNEPAEAESQFREYLKADPDNLEAQTGLGTCLMTLGRLADARKLFLQVEARAPEQFEVRRRLGELELSCGRLEQALEWVLPLAEKWPEDKIVCLVAAQALQQTARADEALKYWDAVRRAEESLSRLEKLTRAVRDDPANADLRYQIGMMLMRFRSREDGVGWLQSLLQYEPNHRGAHRALADYYARIGDSELADRHRRVADSASQVPRDR